MIQDSIIIMYSVKIHTIILFTDIALSLAVTTAWKSEFSDADTVCVKS